jgi:hypothetical protein
LSLGNIIHDFDEFTSHRQSIAVNFMKEAKQDPSKVSPDVRYEIPSADILGQVLELRWFF